MPLRPVHLLLPLLGVALAFLNPWSPPDIVKVRSSRTAAARGGAAPHHAAAGHWSDARFLTREMEKACEWASVATNVDYIERPTAVSSDPQRVAGFLREDWDAAFRMMGAKDDAAVATMASQAAQQLVAAYDPKSNTVHILPGVVTAVAAAAGSEALESDDVLRLLLVRMAVIAMDRQIFPEWKAAADKAETLDALNTAGAVLHGHAQYVTERIAKQWQKDVGFHLGAFDDLVTLLTADRPSGAASPFGTRLQAEVKFAVVKGHAFVTAISRKTRPGIAGVLKNPPKDRKAIFAPKDYIAGFYAKPPAKSLAGAVHEAVVPSLWAKGEWQREERDLAKDDAVLLLQPLEKMMYSTVMAGYLSGKAWTITEGARVDGLLVLQFRKPGLAEAFVNLRGGAVKQSGGTMAEGAGRDSGLPGFHGSETREDVMHWMQWTSEGRYVVGLRTTIDMSGETAREPWDDALESAAEALAKQQKTRTNRRDKGK